MQKPVQSTNSMQVPKDQNHRTNHKERQIRCELAGIHQPHGNTEKNPRNQAQVKFHGFFTSLVTIRPIKITHAIFYHLKLTLAPSPVKKLERFNIA